jgi:hypothetical protein
MLVHAWVPVVPVTIHYRLSVVAFVVILWWLCNRPLAAICALRIRPD